MRPDGPDRTDRPGDDVTLAQPNKILVYPSKISH
jgi:hypothetical protein